MDRLQTNFLGLVQLARAFALCALHSLAAFIIRWPVNYSVNCCAVDSIVLVESLVDCDQCGSVGEYYLFSTGHPMAQRLAFIPAATDV